jgi:uncharacterized membrane protein
MNRKIIIAVVVIGGAGVINAWTHSRPVSTVILGAYILLFVLAIADMFGPPLSDIAGAIAMLAVVVVLLTEFPWQTILSLVQGKQSSTPAGGGHVGLKQ